MRWLRRKREAPQAPSDPDYINGFRVRHHDKACPICDADPKSWCASDCTALDVMDYR